MLPSRVLADRCAVCDGALRAAERRTVRGLPFALCACCGHCQVEREPAPLSDETFARRHDPASWRWKGFERAARRLLALRSLGYDGGRLLDLGDVNAFANIAAAGPFQVVRVGAKDPEEPSFTSLLECLSRLDLPPASFRVVTLWRGLAREPQPVALLEHLRRLLEPGGVLALAARVEQEPAALRRSPRGCDPLIAARHIFSRNSLRMAVLRAGLDVNILVPADVQPAVEGLRAHERFVARTSLSILGSLARERRYAMRFIPGVLWRLADTAELWATRRTDPR